MGNIRAVVITVSDACSRGERRDTSGEALKQLVTDLGAELIASMILSDDLDPLVQTLREFAEREDVNLIVTTGGTGLSKRDSTHEAILQLLDKRLDGFGELFRMLSYHEIGAAAMMSRACAGASKGKVVVSLPGSENAVRLAMTKLILPELGHMVREVSR